MNKLTLEQAAAQVKMKATQIETRPDGLASEWDWEGTHWRITLTREWWESIGPAREPIRRRRMWVVYWSQGSAHGGAVPEVRDVLASLWMDVEGVRTEYGRRWGLKAHAIRPFGLWAREYGYDEDSRKAERIYKACVRAARAWARFWDGTEIIQGGEA